MGTNYYLHLGKRTSQGTGRSSKFSWAVGRTGGYLEHYGATTVIDEHGQEMTWAEFMDLVHADQEDKSTIGQTFS